MQNDRLCDKGKLAVTENNVEDNEIICHCTCTTRRQIRTLIHNGSDTVEKISVMTGAATGCGACETWIEELLVERRQSCE